MPMVVRSRHLSWFQRGEAVFLYHDLYGFLLEMSRDLKDFIDWFAEPHDAEQALAHFKGKHDEKQIIEFLSVFWQQRALVAPDAEELDGLVEAVPIKGPWIVVGREADGTMTAVISRGFGDEPYAEPRLLRLDTWQAELWRRIDGERTLLQLAGSLSEDLDGDPRQDLGRAVVSVAAWTHSAVQLTRVLLKPRSQLPRLPSYATSTMPYPPLATDEGATLAPTGTRAELHDNTLNLQQYHQSGIEDAEAQFEEKETTLSHLFSEPHPALQDRTFAEAFLAAAQVRGWLHGGERVVEVGGGTGRFAAGVLQASAELWPDKPLDYTIVDLSPTLHAAQQLRLAPWAAQARSTVGQGEELNFPDGSVDFLISNEVIADFRIGFVSRNAVKSQQVDAETSAEALALCLAYKLPIERAPEPVPIQVGATRLLERLAQVLRPGGTAVLTEFGGLEQFPIESSHLDHAEYSVHFGHLVVVARALGLEVEVVPLPELLGLRGDVWVLSSTRTQFRNLRHLLRIHGGDLRKRALTPEQFALACGQALRPERIEGVKFQPVAERVMGLQPAEFQALIVRRPG